MQTTSHQSGPRANRSPLLTPALLAVSALVLAGCGTGGAGSAVGQGSAAATSGGNETRPEAKEAPGPTPRLVLTHDQGLSVLDAKTLESVAELPMDGFNRLNPAGDGRHVLVSGGDAFHVLDAGVWTEAHGDHGHSYAAAPRLTDRAFAANKAGHVVTHADTTVLFSDGSGTAEIFDPATLAGALATGLPPTSTYTAPEAHHGVAIGLEGGKLLVTLGNEEGHSGMALLGAPDAGGGQDRRELLRNEACPGVHGEAVAGEATVVVGCEDGMLIYRDGAFTKVPSPDPYGRMGNQAGTAASPVILGDYKVDRDAELERPTRISLVNTDTGKLKLVALGVSYSFRSLGRGPAGEALVLGTDGALHVIDPLTGEVTADIPVVGAWEEPEVWQDPRPALFVLGSKAYITEPATSSIHAVDLKTGKVVKSAELAHAPNEMSGVVG
ncbi:zinc metallochaperone AztD [Pseudarthrobacter sulfonivorans]|uniref:zinc metallochaperone AztD n=1 Tax=Pseudarthrobacter sulfonivorans TaxID=121292 RepID=UPI0028671866|nr:zinc metallochaperone AztD [Pseudarthrobacter sulfonivorans]MDR6416710.1 hypothetical protein [Pseudarthrobacter sulfonivorans]